MRLTQGTFSFLPDLTDEQILAQVRFALARGYAISVEWTDDPHPRNCYWEMWGLPLFDTQDAAAVVYEINECRKTVPQGYVKVNAFDAARGVESCVLSFLVQRPQFEPGFYLDRQEVDGRNLRYTIKSYAVEGNAEGRRYA